MNEIRKQIVKKWSQEFSKNKDMDFNTAMEKAMEEYLTEVRNAENANAESEIEELKGKIEGLEEKLNILTESKSEKVSGETSGEAVSGSQSISGSENLE